MSNKTRAYIRTLFLGLVACLLLGPLSVSATAAPSARDPKLPDLPDLPTASLPSLPGGGITDCKDAPVPDSPGGGIGGFFSPTPSQLPEEADPFAKQSRTTIYEQYGYAGLRWETYDLGCGPDMMRQPDAVTGTAMANWVMQAPIALTGLTSSVTQEAFQPSFLQVLDSPLSRVSTALHNGLFATWAPGIIALLGIAIMIRSRAQSLSTTAGAIGWAILIVLLTTALFRWPVAAGQAADTTVTSTVGAAVTKVTGHRDLKPGTAVSSNIHEALLYRAWLAGTFGNPDSPTAQEYGDDLFRAQALTWREAETLRTDPDAGKELIEKKQNDFKEIADKIKDEDPTAYEHLTGKRSETRVGYAVLATLGVLLALPFLLIAALLMLGCFLVVRLAVMMFPAFAVLGLFPAARGIVTGLGRTVGAAIINSIVFGIGAGVTIAILGILFGPGGGTPAWLAFVLMPLFSFMMWVALKPFRRLTAMGGRDPFNDMAGSFGNSSRTGWRMLKRTVVTSAAAGVGGGAGAAVGQQLADDDEQPTAPPERAEARPAPQAPGTEPLALAGAKKPSPDSRTPGPQAENRASVPLQGPAGRPGRHAATPEQVTAARQPPETPAIEGFRPRPSSGSVPPPPTEAEWIDGDEVYRIYRPDDHQPDQAGVA